MYNNVLVPNRNSQIILASNWNIHWLVETCRRHWFLAPLTFFLLAILVELLQNKNLALGSVGYNRKLLSAPFPKALLSHHDLIQRVFGHSYVAVNPVSNWSMSFSEAHVWFFPQKESPMKCLSTLAICLSLNFLPLHLSHCNFAPASHSCQKNQG